MVGRAALQKTDDCDGELSSLRLIKADDGDPESVARAYGSVRRL